jgi:hypothetical protein
MHTTLNPLSMMPFPVTPATVTASRRIAAALCWAAGGLYRWANRLERQQLALRAAAPVNDDEATIVMERRTRYGKLD